MMYLVNWTFHWRTFMLFLELEPNWKVNSSKLPWKLAFAEGHQHFSEAKVTPSNVFFCLTKSPYIFPTCLQIYPRWSMFHPRKSSLVCLLCSTHLTISLGKQNNLSTSLRTTLWCLPLHLQYANRTATEHRRSLAASRRADNADIGIYGRVLTSSRLLDKLAGLLSSRGLLSILLTPTQRDNWAVFN